MSAPAEGKSAKRLSARDFLGPTSNCLATPERFGGPK
jgi:hypothetical protein